MDEARSKKLKLTNNTDVCEAIDSDHGVSLLRRQQNDEWCDILLFGNDDLSPTQGIKAHKSTLASASPHFREAFESNGFLDSGAKEYRVTQIGHVTLQLIIDFIYQSALRIAGENISERLKMVLIGADYLLMPDLVYVCGELLDDPKYLNINCAIDAWLFARKYHCQVLENAAVCTCVSDLHEVPTQTDLLMLSRADVVSFLKCLVLAAPLSADLVCETATAWLGFDEAERRADCNEVMCQIPLKSMSADALKRLSEIQFLPEHVLWAVHQVREVRAEVDKIQNELRNARLVNPMSRFTILPKPVASMHRPRLQSGMIGKM